ncbi:flagellar biosynthesis protein FlhF [Ornithinibacillus bavariensis]|uniref:Flagellar biosynthesis protein FlhF n=1 Tax=Ornithinibacillus bavariensis TaxID=545502 RepID=A0A920C6J2_9BACI|nr:flagellar biosynthesis protein FlhF [Ornithinibacillus bavariensis]GIO26169.1 flagellar biosynthesis protein FlhF [Ornithinibacillus bavariensis]
MKVKKYIAPTMPEAMSKIRKELGSDAVILSSKEIEEGGFLGFFKKRKIEVVAALDKAPLPSKQIKATVNKNENRSNYKKQHLSIDNDMMQEIKNMRRILEQQAHGQNNKFELDYQVVYQYLLDQEVDERVATNIVENVKQHLTEVGATQTPAKIAQELKLEIERQLGGLSFDGIPSNAKVIHFLGPTGVGKTTTIAKIAANSMLKDKKSVAFITMDTYRIAAIEQLKTYAKILEVPVEVAYSAVDYHHAITKFQNYDLILVDTAGRNYRDDKFVKELSVNIDGHDQAINFLVLSLTAKSKDMNDIYHSFRHIKLNGLIFTKIDETRQYGGLLNIPLAHQIGIAYITNGQEVPDNILKPTEELISEYIVGDLIDT